MFKKKLNIKLDGIILTDIGSSISEHNFGKLIRGVKESLEYLKEKYSIIIRTERKSEPLVRRYLIQNGIPFDKLIIDFKENYDIYIDDKCICFEGDWQDTEKGIINFIHYNNTLKKQSLTHDFKGVNLNDGIKRE